MEPWERHAAGAGMKRFSYAAVSELQQHSHPGFLVTCAFRREKSATHEILELLSQYISTDNTTTDETTTDTAKPSDEAAREFFSLIKVSGSGIIFLSTSTNTLNVVGIVKKVLDDVDAGTTKATKWCSRLSPVQATCLPDKDAIRSTVLDLLKLDAGGLVSKTKEHGLKYAVGFNKRSSEDGSSGIERAECFDAVASAMKEFRDDVSVDLSNPEILVAVEMLPVVGLKDGPLCGISLLPKEVVNMKPRAAIKPISNGDEAPVKKQKR